MVKKLAVVVCGWHYPSHFYEKMLKQNIPDGWGVEYFIISHRDPIHSHGEKEIKSNTDDLLESLDSILYKKNVTKEYLQDLGWDYFESKKNGVEWRAANTWLENNNYKDYDCFLFCGDDTLILRDDLFLNALENKKLVTYEICGEKGDATWLPEERLNDDWLILSNGLQYGKKVSMRASFEFFKPELLDRMGGKFDLSIIKLNRDGIVDSPKNHSDLSDWNSYLYPFVTFLTENNLYKKLRFLSTSYRASDFIVECERGLLSNHHALTSNYINAINKLYNAGVFNKFLDEYYENKQ